MSLCRFYESVLSFVFCDLLLENVLDEIRKGAILGPGNSDQFRLQLPVNFE